MPMTENDIHAELTKLATLMEMREAILALHGQRALVADGTNPTSVTMTYNTLRLTTSSADLIEQGRVALYNSYQTQLEALIEEVQTERRAD